MRTKTKFTFNFVLFVHFLSNVSKDQLYIIYIFNFVCTRISWSSENLSAWFEKKKKKKKGTLHGIFSLNLRQTN